MRIPSVIDLTVKESQKGKAVKENGLEKLATLEKRMKGIERIGRYDLVKAAEICLVPNVGIPKTFRVLKFVKYTKTQWPITLLITYNNKIVKVVHEEKLLIHLFQDNLSDIALIWYMQLDNTKVKRWKDLVNVFIKQYKFNMDMNHEP